MLWVNPKYQKIGKFRNIKIIIERDIGDGT
jgi:hypothetical protein